MHAFLHFCLFIFPGVYMNHIELLLRLIWKKVQIFVFSMIVLLMLTQRSWMLFWALADKQMSMKMMTSILKIAMKVMTIQLTKKKKKILTNYQNEALCKTFFHVIYIIDDIFCNTKYLFYKFIYVLFKHYCYYFVQWTVYHLSVCRKVNRQYKYNLSCTMNYHRRQYRRMKVRRHFTESWKIITGNATITDELSDDPQSVGIS